MKRRTFLRASAAAAIPLVAGCTGTTGDGGGSPTPAATPTDTPASTPTPTSMPTDTPASTPAPTTDATGGSGAQSKYPDYNWDRLADADATATSTISLRNTAFHPLVAEVEAGTEVRFENRDPFSHTVTIPALGVDEELGGGESVSVTFGETGTFDYVCTLHPPGMLGRVVVSESVETPAETGTLTATPTPTPTPTPTSAPGGGYY